MRDAGISVAWQTSTYSNQTNCVEVAKTKTVVLVRDSKNPGGNTLRFDLESWRSFLQEIQKKRVPLS